ncbi:SAM-dependent methyltransferase [Saccharopolyspora spinosa]|uniref:SAM-dependent methyltransferase n=1 Tax=Saccharopolyspora spinosa TaxID=60894 RepID=UPI0002379F9F|nr:class I SAM-dependent methyltransferase [Saccharopolyspora spinosa]
MPDGRAEDLSTAPAPRDAAEVVDLGCWWGELRLLEAEPSADGTGIDITDEELARGRNAEVRGVAERVRFVQSDAARWAGTTDIAISVSSSHAWAVSSRRSKRSGPGCEAVVGCTPAGPSGTRRRCGTTSA